MTTSLPARFRAAGKHWPIRALRWVARSLGRLLVGADAAPLRMGFTRALFFRALGLTYLVAFTSLRVQLPGLYGARGILPIADYLDRVRRFTLIPTIFWRDSSDRTLMRACKAGQLLSILLLLGIAPRATAACLWVLYLSFVSAGRDFMAFQWDSLLLEAGFDSLVLAPSGLHSPLLGPEEPSRIAAHLLRFLFFRLYFESGLCKVQSGDPAWRDLTACAYHYETQPLPTPLSWHAHHLPPKIQRLSTRMVLGVELIVPALLYLPRRVRRTAVATLVLFQLLIAATGNYGFFNLLTAVLALWAADDAVLARLLPAKMRDPILRAERQPASLRRELASAAAVLPLLACSVLQLLRRFDRTRDWVDRADELPALGRLRDALGNVRAVNSYGLFAVMTTSRPEILVEGSNDGADWKPYEFRYKAGEPGSAPRFVAPHQPRLDWQMWFAAMEPPPEWFLAFVARLLTGAPEVQELLRSNPFPERPPRLIRASYFDYRFTTPGERRKDGTWWKRKRLGLYLPASEFRESDEAA